MEDKLYFDVTAGVYVKPAEITNRFLIGFPNALGKILWDTPDLDSEWDVVDRYILSQANN